jgi:hypothetical protein
MQRLKAHAVTYFKLRAIPLPGGVAQSPQAGHDRKSVELSTSLPRLTGEYNQQGECAILLTPHHWCSRREWRYRISSLS